VQQKILSLELNGPVSCADLANVVSFINSNFSSISPLSHSWAAHPEGWQYSWSGEMHTPSDTTPDPVDTFTFDGQITSGFEYPNSTISQANPGVNAGAIRLAFLLPDSTIYIVGIWHDSSNGFTWQQSCVMTGTASGCGYVFDIPVPPLDLCSSSESASGGGGGPQYAVYTTSDYGGYFTDFQWSAFAAACAANPTICGASTSPGACLSPDPFYGDEPP
jgi:hypothetical protein